jgi:hypothetical protein
MKAINNISRALCCLGTAIFFLSFLAASAPHRVHHLLENLPPPKTANRDLRATSLSSPRDHSGASQPSSESQARSAAHDPTAHDRSSHPHHHGKKSTPLHSHSHSHAHHSHRHDPAPVQTTNAVAPSQPESEPLHANAPKRDAHHDNSAQTDCIVQAAAQHGQFAPVQNVEIAFLKSQFDLRFAAQSVAFTAFDPAPFSQRAPPLT